MANFMENWLKRSTSKCNGNSNSRLTTNINEIEESSDASTLVSEQGPSMLSTQNEESMETNSGEEISTSEIGQTTKLKKRYKQKFREKWINRFPFIEERNNKNYCKVCGLTLTGGVFNIIRHSKSNFHVKNYNAAKKSPKLKDKFRSSAPPFDKTVKRAELILSAFINEHNLSFRLMDHLPLMIAAACPDSKIAKNLSIKLKKATQLTVEVLGPAGYKEVVADIKENPYCFIFEI